MRADQRDTVEVLFSENSIPPIELAGDAAEPIDTLWTTSSPPPRSISSWDVRAARSGWSPGVFESQSKAELNAPGVPGDVLPSPVWDSALMKLWNEPTSTNRL